MKAKTAWDTQTTSGLSNPGALIDATVANLPGAWSADSNFFYPPSSGTVTPQDRRFLKPIYIAGSVTLAPTNCAIAPSALGVAYAVGFDASSTATFAPTDCEFDLTQCGKSYSAGIYQASGAVYGADCYIHDAALNFHDMFNSAVHGEWQRSWFQSFGKKAVTNDHCEPFHNFSSGELKLVSALIDERSFSPAANTVTSTLCFPEGDGPTPTITLDGVVHVDDGNRANAPYTIQWGGGNDTSISRVNMVDSAIQAGASAYFAKSALGRLYGARNYDLDSGSLVSASYDGSYP